jgi:homeobox-leucine zipper protein
MQTVNRKLTAMNKLLMEENDRLQKQLSRLIFEKEASAKSLKTHIHNVSSMPCLQMLHGSVQWKWFLVVW